MDQGRGGMAGGEILAEGQPRFPGWHRFVNSAKATIITLLRKMDLIAPDVAALEPQIAALVEEYPNLASVFEYARGNPRLLAHLVGYARYLVDERMGRVEPGWEDEYFRRRW